MRERVAALLALTVFLGSQLAGALHTATERHAVCPEHGEIIHLSDDDGNTLALAERSHQSEHGGPEARPSAPLPSEDDHDHCDLCPTSRERGALSSPVAHSVTSAELAVDSQVITWRDPSASDLYILAPKNSPPA